MEKATLKNDGFALIYGLAVFFLASVGGLSILVISQKDRATAGDYSKMRSAALIARAALSAFEGQCKSQPQTVVDILKGYNVNHSKKWLLGDAAQAGFEHKFKCSNAVNAPYFSACIMKFDSVNLLLQVQGIGYGGFGGKKKAIGIYKLEGIQAITTWKQKDAIHLAGSARNFDQPVIVQGNVYCGADIHFNGSSSGSVINGDLKTGNSSTSTSSFDGSTTINGTAFFQTQVTINGSATVTINGKSGFAKNIWVDKMMELHGDTYLNGVVNGNSTLNMYGNMVTHSGMVTWSDIYNSSASKLINNSGSIDIASVLGMNSEDSLSFIGNINSIHSDKIFLVSSLDMNNITASKLNQKYNEASSNGKLWNGFLVIQINQPVSMSASFDTFEGKVILIVDNTLNCNGDWYNCSATSNTLVYVRSGGRVNGLGSGKNFRGYVYVEGSGDVTYQMRSGNSFRGAIHHVSANSPFKINSGAALNIQYDESVLKEFVNLGVVSPPGAITSEFVLNDHRIRTELLSIFY